MSSPPAPSRPPMILLVAILAGVLGCIVGVITGNWLITILAGLVALFGLWLIVGVGRQRRRSQPP